MKLRNLSDYDTRMLRRILVAVHNHIARHEGRLDHWNRMIIEVNYTRTRYIAGRATMSGRNLSRAHGSGKPAAMWLWLARPTTRGSRNAVTDVIWLAYHEFMHSYGYKHDQYADLPGREAQAIADTIGLDRFRPLDLKVSKPKRERDVVAERYVRLLGRERKWQTRLKRAQTMLSKLKRQLREYERRHGERIAAYRKDRAVPRAQALKPMPPGGQDGP